MESKIKRKLLEVGLNPALAGYDYIVDALQLIIKNRQAYRSNMVALYKDVAEKFDTTRYRVERNIRTAMRSACQNGGNDKLKEIFGIARESSFDVCLTNSHFIWGLAEYFTLESRKD